MSLHGQWQPVPTRSLCVGCPLTIDEVAASTRLSQASSETSPVECAVPAVDLLYGPHRQNLIRTASLRMKAFKCHGISLFLTFFVSAYSITTTNCTQTKLRISFASNIRLYTCCTITILHLALLSDLSVIHLFVSCFQPWNRTIYIHVCGYLFCFAVFDSRIKNCSWEKKL